MIVIVTLSLLTAVYISIERFLHVYYLQKYNITRKKSVVGLFVLWISPFIVMFSVRGLFYTYGGREAGKKSTRIAAAVVITLCIVLIIASYLGILVLLRKHLQKTRDTLQSNYLENQSRASKTSLIIVVCVVVMNTPALFYSIILSTNSKTSNWFCAITLMTLLGSSALNPLVYCLIISTIKKHIFMLICCRGNDKVEKGEEEEKVRMRIMSHENNGRQGDSCRWTEVEHLST